MAAKPRRGATRPRGRRRRAREGHTTGLAEPFSSDAFSTLGGSAGEYGVRWEGHEPSGGRRFLNPGSVGCHDQAEARALILTSADSAIDVARLAVPYDDTGLLRAFDERHVPWRDFILRAFIRRP